MSTSSSSGRSRSYQLGKYQVRAHIASGGMGAVYRAVDTETGREVALKVLPPEYATKPNVLERFRREFYHGVKLCHENIAALYEFDEVANTYFLAMEFVDGISLYEHIRARGRLQPDEAREIVIQVARALDHAHQLNIIHRDIKPSNILLTNADGRTLVKVIDLGLARETHEEDCRLTRDGTTVGTVDYLAPEQARNSRSADIRSDIYSLGCTLFHMLSGTTPFPEGTLTERIFKHADAEPPDLRGFNPDIPADLLAVCRKMMAKKPVNRYQTPAELLRALLGEEKSTAEAVGRIEKPSEGVTKENAGAGRIENPSHEIENPSHGGNADVGRIVNPSVPGEAPAPPPARRKRRSALHPPGGAASRAVPEPPASHVSGKETCINLPGTPAATTILTEDPSPSSPEHRQVANAQFQRATQVIADGNHDYGLTLLLACCRLDPTNLLYRHALRQTYQEPKVKERRRRWRDCIRSALVFVRFQRAKSRHAHVEVLNLGEEILSWNPSNVAVQLDMAAAAEAAGFINLAVWLLEQAKLKDSQHLRVNRALACLFEKQQDFPRALGFWELVKHADPGNAEAQQKLKDLAARETIVRGRYEELV